MLVLALAWSRMRPRNHAETQWQHVQCLFMSNHCAAGARCSLLVHYHTQRSTSMHSGCIACDYCAAGTCLNLVTCDHAQKSGGMRSGHIVKSMHSPPTGPSFLLQPPGWSTGCLHLWKLGHQYIPVPHSTPLLDCRQARKWEGGSHCFFCSLQFQKTAMSLGNGWT